MKKNKNIRDFIQETIDQMKHYSFEIEKLYSKLKEEEITVEKFEEEYRIYLDNMKNTCEDEYSSPNNHCEYTLNNGNRVMSNDYADEE